MFNKLGDPLWYTSCTDIFFIIICQSLFNHILSVGIRFELNMEDTLKRRVSGRKRAREKTKDTPNKWRDEQETNRNPTRRRKIDNEDRNMAKHQKNMNRSDLVTNKGTSFDECWFANSFHASSRAKSHQNPSSEVGGTSLVKNIIGSSASKEHFSQGDDDTSVPDIHKEEHLSVSSVNESIFSNLSASTPKTDRKDKVCGVYGIVQLIY